MRVVDRARTDCRKNFPAKPVGCYGDGGAVFTDNDEWAQLMNSYRVHGKGTDKYDNVRIGMNSRLDTLQAAILQVKLHAFDEEVERVNEAARHYTRLLKDHFKTPVIPEGCGSSWAQYTIQLTSAEQRSRLSLGFVLWQTSHWQPMVGTPHDVPVPKNVSFILSPLTSYLLLLTS